MKKQHPGVWITPNQCRVLLLIKDGPRFTFEIQTYSDVRALRELDARGWLRTPLGGVYRLTQQGLHAAMLARSAAKGIGWDV